MPNKAIDELISQFKILASISEITEDKALIEYFKPAISKELYMDIMKSENIPTTLNEWYTRSARLAHAYAECEAFQKRQKRTYTPPTTTTETPDPNAMQIDATRLSDEERQRYFKEGQCFVCSVRGHISKECPKRKKRPFQNQRTTIRAAEVPENPTPTTSATSQPAPTAAKTTSAAAQIRALLAQLSQEEKEELIEEGGF